MVVDNTEAYMDYCSVSTWWDQCKSSGHVSDSKVQLGEDFVVENAGYSFHVYSHGHELFKFIKGNNTKPEINFYITALCTAEQFEVIYQAFIRQISESYETLAEDASIKEMIDEPNSITLIDNLTKKYSTCQDGNLETEGGL